MAKNRKESLQEVFLEESARYLAASTPSTSAYLIAERLTLLSENERRSYDTLRHDVCKACGTFVALGWTSTMAGMTGPTKQQPGKRKRRKVACVCLLCHRETVTALPLASKPGKTAQATSTEPMSSGLLLGTSSTVRETLEKPGSKRRAKIRKEKNGLQALLDKSKQNTTTSPALDLMDFLKS